MAQWSQIAFDGTVQANLTVLIKIYDMVESRASEMLNVNCESCDRKFIPSLIFLKNYEDQRGC